MDAGSLSIGFVFTGDIKRAAALEEQSPPACQALR